MIRKKEIIFADTLDELIRKSFGLYHDHCYHLFRGKTADVMDKYEYKDLMEGNKEYCFIYEEDIPHKIPKKHE